MLVPVVRHPLDLEERRGRRVVPPPAAQPVIANVPVTVRRVAVVKASMTWSGRSPRRRSWPAGGTSRPRRGREVNVSETRERTGAVHMQGPTVSPAPRRIRSRSTRQACGRSAGRGRSEHPVRSRDRTGKVGRGVGRPRPARHRMFRRSRRAPGQFQGRQVARSRTDSDLCAIKKPTRGANVTATVTASSTENGPTAERSTSKAVSNADSTELVKTPAAPFTHT